MSIKSFGIGFSSRIIASLSSCVFFEQYVVVMGLASNSYVSSGYSKYNISLYPALYRMVFVAAVISSIAIIREYVIMSPGCTLKKSQIFSITSVCKFMPLLSFDRVAGEMILRSSVFFIFLLFMILKSLS